MRWSRIDSVFLASSLIREYDKIKPYDTEKLALKYSKNEVLQLMKKLKKINHRGHQVLMFAKVYEILSQKNEELIK